MLATILRMPQRALKGLRQAQTGCSNLIIYYTVYLKQPLWTRKFMKELGTSGLFIIYKVN